MDHEKELKQGQVETGREVNGRKGGDSESPRRRQVEANVGSLGWLQGQQRTTTRGLWGRPGALGALWLPAGDMGPLNLLAVGQRSLIG